MDLLEVEKSTKSVKTEPQCPKLDRTKCISVITDHAENQGISLIQKVKVKIKQANYLNVHKWVLPMPYSSSHRTISFIVSVT